MLSLESLLMQCWNISDDDDQAEVTGSAEVEHLSRFAPLRRARSAIQEARSSEGSRDHSSRDSRMSPITQGSHRPSIVSASQSAMSISPSVIADTAQSALSAPLQLPPPLSDLSEQVPPHLQPDYSTFIHETLPLQTAYSGDGSQYMPDMTTAVPISQPSMDHYIRTADEMSGYLTWQTTEIPPWLNFGNLFPPG